MDRVNRGKQFEQIVKTAFEKVSNCSVDRMHDQTTGFSGSSNICDFIVYKKPYILYLECKCVYGNTLPFSNITDTQWYGMLTKAQKVDGVIAGVIIWFIDHDYTTFIPIQALESHKRSGEKSINIKQLRGNFEPKKLLPYGQNDVRIIGKKKQIFFEYDIEGFLSYLYWLEGGS